jgi:hypothetical protein
MSCFDLSPQARLSHWRDFRQSLVDQPSTTQLDETAAYWAQAPLNPKPIDLNGLWPNTWSMLVSNNYCRHSVAICLESTLRLAGWSSERLTLQLIDDVTPLLVLVADDVILNYAWGTVYYGRINQPIRRQWRYVERDYRPI